MSAVAKPCEGTPRQVHQYGLVARHGTVATITHKSLQILNAIFFSLQTLSAVLSDSALPRRVLHNYTARDASTGIVHAKIYSIQSHLILDARNITY